MDIEQGSLFSMEDWVQPLRSYEDKLCEVANKIAQTLWTSTRTLNPNHVKTWMTKAFGGSDADGQWQWKDVYDAQEAAMVMLIAQHGQQLRQLSFDCLLNQLSVIEHKQLTHTRRTEESIDLQQFSTPFELAAFAARCADVTASDLVLEPSAGTGLLARFAMLNGAQVALNELSDRRRAILRHLFPGRSLYGFNAEQIHDFLPDGVSPTVILMNPPFSSSPNIDRRNPHALGKHVRSAFLRLAPGGRMVLISAHWFAPGSPFWNEAFREIETVSVPLTVEISGRVYAKHGTRIETRLTVIDKVNGNTPMQSFALSQALLSPTTERSRFGENFTLNREVVQQIIAALPKRSELQPVVSPVATPPARSSTSRKSHKALTGAKEAATQALPVEGVPVRYAPIEAVSHSDALQDALYEVYQPQRIRILDAHPHPTTLCESAALASVLPPVPTYQPLLPSHLIEQARLSEAQLESVIYAGEAHAQFLSGYYLVNASWDEVEVATSSNPQAVRFRRGWFLGDGTGAGKGRQVAGMILDNFCHGRTKAVWISKSDKLIEDARRDWVALGGDTSQIVSLSSYRLGQDISLSQGIVFTTYATLRTEKPGVRSRLQQLLDWLGATFEGIIAFDEAHAMSNAAAEAGEIGVKSASQQGLAGLRLQNALPQARVVYVSATGASKVNHLAYAARLGLWQTGDLPFPSREDFITAIAASGVAAMEVVCRDLKALGLYTARNLSFDGVEVEPLEVPLTEAQIAIYDTYASAFQIVHSQLDAALRACNIVGDTKTLNGRAKMSVYSQFESHKQRFFNHLITAIKCPAMIRAIEQDLREGYAVVIQLVSTNESLLERRLSDIPGEEWVDLNIDITPREYVLDYLVHSFPVHLYEEYETSEGDLRSRPVIDDEGNPVKCREALEIQAMLVEHITALPPSPSALDQVILHFGHEAVAEVTGRSLRILKEMDTGRQSIATRSSASNLDETRAFMDDEKRILVFSRAGGTGRSYHADLAAKNRRRRKHYLLEAGWQADEAIQGLGRSHRTNQASAPIFCPVVTTVRGERRFISTIARRLDALGALTRGQRQTGGQGLFDSRDNLESIYAADALRQFFMLLARNEVEGYSLARFEAATGLSLLTSDGTLRHDLPTIQKFLNRLLAMPIADQNKLFGVFELLIESNIDAAIAAGTFEAGVETLQADNLTVVQRDTVYTHPTGGETVCVEVERRDRTPILGVAEALALRDREQGQLVINARSNRAAVKIATTSVIDGETGAIKPRVALVRPTERTRMLLADYEQSSWQAVELHEWQRVWEQEVAETPEFLSSRLFLMTGLLLPIWTVLDDGNLRVYRLQTETGERLLGRVIEPKHRDRISESLGLRKIVLTPHEIFTLVMDERKPFTLPGGLVLRSSFVASERRLEITGSHISDALCDQLKAQGCFTEIIQYRRRVFLPANARQGTSVIAKVVELLT